MTTPLAHTAPLPTNPLSPGSLRLRHFLGLPLRWLARLRFARLTPEHETLDALALSPHQQRDLNLRGIPDAWLEHQQAVEQYERHRAGTLDRPIF